MGTIFLVYGMCRSVGMSVVSKMLRRRVNVTHAHAQSQGGKNLPLSTVILISTNALEQLYHGRKRTVHLEMVNLKQKEL